MVWYNIFKKKYNVMGEKVITEEKLEKGTWKDVRELSKKFLDLDIDGKPYAEPTEQDKLKIQVLCLEGCIKSVDTMGELLDKEHRVIW